MERVGASCAQRELCPPGRSGGSEGPGLVPGSGESTYCTAPGKRSSQEHGLRRLSTVPWPCGLEGGEEGCLLGKETEAAERLSKERKCLRTQIRLSTQGQGTWEEPWRTAHKTQFPTPPHHGPKEDGDRESGGMK